MNDESTLRDITIGGLELSVEVPYSEGHVLTKAEASQLNQVYLENIGNNFRNRARELQEAGKGQGEIQEELDKYAAEYEFGHRRVGGPRKPVDRLQVEMRALAKKAVVEYCKAKDLNFREMAAEQQEALIAKYLEKYGDQVRPIAERRLADAASLGAAVLD